MSPSQRSPVSLAWPFGPQNGSDRQKAEGLVVFIAVDGTAQWGAGACFAQRTKSAVALPHRRGSHCLRCWWVAMPTVGTMMSMTLWRRLRSPIDLACHGSLCDGGDGLSSCVGGFGMMRPPSWGGHRGVEGEGGVGMAGLWGSVAGAHVLSATGLILRLSDGVLDVRHKDALICGALG